MQEYLSSVLSYYNSRKQEKSEKRKAPPFTDRRNQWPEPIQNSMAPLFTAKKPRAKLAVSNSAGSKSPGLHRPARRGLHRQRTKKRPCAAARERLGAGRKSKVGQRVGRESVRESVRVGESDSLRVGESVGSESRSLVRVGRRKSESLTNLLLAVLRVSRIGRDHVICSVHITKVILAQEDADHRVDPAVLHIVLPELLHEGMSDFDFVDNCRR